MKNNASNVVGAQEAAEALGHSSMAAPESFANFDLMNQPGNALTGVFSSTEN